MHKLCPFPRNGVSARFPNHSLTGGKGERPIAPWEFFVLCSRGPSIGLLGRHRLFSHPPNFLSFYPASLGPCPYIISLSSIKFEWSFVFSQFRFSGLFSVYAFGLSSKAQIHVYNSGLDSPTRYHWHLQLSTLGAWFTPLNSPSGLCRLNKC